LVNTDAGSFYHALVNSDLAAHDSKLTCLIEQCL